MGSWRFRGAVTVVALLLLAVLASAAQAAVTAPVKLAASGDHPNVTLDGANNAHIVWIGRGAQSAQLFYCRVPAGGSACAPLTQIAAPGDSLSLPIAVDDGTGSIRVFSYRYGLSGPSFAQVLEFTSTDGGNSFGAGIPVGLVAPYDTAPGPGAAVSVIDSATSCGSCYQLLPLDGSGATGPAVLSTDHPYYGVTGSADASRPLAVFATGGGDGQFRVWTGAGDVNNASTWTPPAELGTLDTPRLAYGPGGLYLVAQDSLSSPIMQVRKFDGTSFGPRIQITTGTRADAAVEDATGRLHVVGGRITAGPTSAGLFYGSSDDGSAWDKDEITFPGVPASMRLSVAADHFGVLVGNYASGDTGAVWLARTGPSAAVPTTAKFVEAAVVSGTVLIQVPPSKQFKQLKKGDVIPIGSVVDATKGRVRITIALPNAKLQSTDFFQGIFKVTQAKAGVATMVLRGGSFKSCARAARSGAVAAKAKVIRQLWGEGAGKFRTKGRYATASIRGTTWDTIDRCDGTLIRVTKGRIVVTDLKKHKNVTLKAGQTYLAKA